jgi:DNA-binding NtrC family response regulator
VKSGSLSNQRATTTALAVLLAMVIIYLLFMRVPAALNTYIIGFSTLIDEDSAVVSKVDPGSPAELAGVKAGDHLLAINKRKINDWLELNQENRSHYVAERYKWREQPAEFTFLRENVQLNLEIMSRPLTLTEIWNHNWARFSLLTFLIILIMSIILARSRDASAFLIGVCFCAAILWLASLDPQWPIFMSPLIRGITTGPLMFNAFAEAWSLQIVMACLLHIALVFPERHSLVRRYRWLITAVYVISLGVPFLTLVMGHGDNLQRIVAVYGPRLWLNTAMLILITLFMVNTYHRSKNPVQRARTRWIVTSIVMLAFVHISLWNLPILITGSPLLPSYSWLFGPIALIPLALTMSILNHELLGIRGIIRGRLHLLEAQLEKERNMVKNRDMRIHTLSSEISELSSSLDDYRKQESGEARNDNSTTSGLSRLEQRYPELTNIRRERLLGASPLWEDVFRQTVLAAHDMTPVLIVGESGTGKTDVAWAIHRLGPQSNKPYKTVSCAQFEHTDPAFALGRIFGIGTGHGLANVAKEGSAGLLQECDGGTLVLDDFDRLPLPVQDLLLYPLEGRPFEPGIGSGPSQLADIKFILATNRDPEQLVQAGELRSDVLARLGARVDLPPLRKRPEDIPILVEHFTRLLSVEMGYEISIVSPRAMNLLTRANYMTGNARELKSEIRTAIGKAMLEDDNVIRAGYLSNTRDTSQTTPIRTSTAIHTPADLNPLDAAVTITTGLPRELLILRKHAFRLKPAEAELGYSHKSRTLSNHLRGLCMLALAENDGDIGLAINWLAGNQDREIHARINSKIRRYLSSIRTNISQSTEQNLYRNLPAAYRESMKIVIHQHSNEIRTK